MGGETVPPPSPALLGYLGIILGYYAGKIQEQDLAWDRSWFRAGVRPRANLLN